MCLVLHSPNASREKLLVFVEAKDGQIENQITDKNGLFALPPREIMHPNAQLKTMEKAMVYAYAGLAHAQKSRI